MNKELSKEKLGLFESVIKLFNTSITNNMLYPSGHPLLEFSMKNFKSVLDTWFANEQNFNLSIAQKSLLLNGDVINSPPNEIHKEVATYFHQKGIASISFLKGLDTNQLLEFFKFIKAAEIKTSSQKNDYLKNFPPLTHIKIKGIDYSSLLSSAKQETTTLEEEDIWKSLEHTNTWLKEDPLPESKVKFLENFLTNPQKTASMLNKIFKEALLLSDGKSGINLIHETMFNIIKHFEKGSADNGKKSRVQLSDILTKLDPSLIASLFEETAIDGVNLTLAKEITKDFSNEMISDFITSFVRGESRLDESLLILFDRIIPEENDTNAVALLVSNNLLGNLDKDGFSKFQESIKEIFKKCPKNRFVSDVYRITVESFIDKTAKIGIFADRYPHLIKECVMSMEKENLEREKIRLLLNILWLESNPVEFKKICDILVGLFKDILSLKHIENIKEILEYFTEKLNPEQKNNENMLLQAKETLDKIINWETIEKITAFIPNANKEELDAIAYICLKANNLFANALIDALIAENTVSGKEKITLILAKLGKEIAENIGDRLRALDGRDLNILKDLFKPLAIINPAEALSIARNIFQRANKQLRIDVIDIFDIFTPQEKGNILLELLDQEKDREIRGKIISSLLKTRDKDVIQKLFAVIMKSRLRKLYLLYLVKSSGDLKLKGAFSYLKEIFTQRHFFNTKKIDELRIAAAISLHQIGLQESEELIKNALLHDRSKSVKRMCKIIMDLDRDNTNNQTIQR